MKKCTIKFSILLAITVGLINSACSNDEWDKHYNNTDVVIINESLSDIIKNETDLTIFSRLMEISGYDTILSSSQTFTVWAPLDSDSAWSAEYGLFLNEDLAFLADTLKIRKLIGNHISRFSYPTSGLDSLRLFMLCSKNADFKWRNNQAFLGNITLGETNIPAKNGLLHKISGYNPYTPGHWEFLTEYPETATLDSLKSFINTLIVEDEYGNMVNNVFKDYAKLDNDDSTYTFIALTNTAWSDALAKALPFHNVYNDYKGLNYEYSKKAIFSNLFFSQVKDPAGLDSMTSTNKIVFQDPDNLIAGATKYGLSNGSMFLTDSLRMKPSESYHKRILVEAETNIFGRSNAMSDLYSRPYTGSQYSISDKKYAFLKYIGTGPTYASLTMSIPDVLSGKYNLYVVTVPTSIDNPTVLKGVKFRVCVTYRRADGSLRGMNNAIYQSHKKPAGSISPGFTASATEVQKIFIKEFDFPFCSMYEKGNPKSLEVQVMIENVAIKSEEKTLTRDLRIDCIIFEPVE